MSRSGNFFDLQTIDTLLDQHRSRLREIAEILTDTSEMEHAEASFQNAEEALKEASKKLKAAEEKVKGQRLKIKSTDAKLYGGRITNPKELEDLQDKSEALKRYLNVLEDRQLESMLELDEYNANHLNAKRNLETVRETTKSRQQDHIQERDKILVDVQNLESRKVSTAALISAEDLALYENLRKKGHGLAVTKVLNRSCSACGATLTAALHQVARSPNQITLCETCGRILFG